MLQSLLFTKTSKTAPKDEEATNVKLLIRGGYARKMSAGVFSYLPLGWRVLEKINNIIREEMNAIGGEELLMPALVAWEYWEKSGRWDTEIMYKISHEIASPAARNDSRAAYGLGWTHEEVITALATHFINSYKDLPRAAYQIQTKFRAEARAKSGLLRGREFMMKDLYSFHADKEDLDDYYQKVIGAYGKILDRLCLKARLTEAAGGAFTKEYTHEFQVLSPVGEDTIFYCQECDFAQNKEIAKVKESDKCPKCGGMVNIGSGIEVANVFKLGTRYSEAFGLNFKDEKGESKPVVMGSYGIGPTRLMGTLVELYHDEGGIIWPDSVAPYKIHLLVLKGKGDAEVAKRAEKVYTDLIKTGAEVLYDDRDVSAGEKFSDADLLGLPWRAVVSAKTEDKIELKRRDEKSANLIDYKELAKLA